ncbi:MAG: chromophore lyase CpcT/CpeT [Prochlorococcus sp.]
MHESSYLRFAKILAGHYSNKAQAQEDPVNFARINIYFQPLHWDVFRAPGYYSEQSYDYDPWRPYRQGIHKLKARKELFIVENYGLPEPIRIAGAGFQPDLLNNICADTLLPRYGCAMHFREITPGHYKGLVEPGNRCLIPREGKMTYLVSEVEFNEQIWVSRDSGFDPKTNEKLWGSEHGPLRFQRAANLGSHLTEGWLNYASR